MYFNQSVRLFFFRLFFNGKIHEKSYTTKMELITEIQRLWSTDIELQLLTKTLSDSMPSRISECIRLKGAATHY
jgi:hypothetical protein